MGNDINPGHTYVDGEMVSGPSLTDHVGEATIKPTFYSSRTIKNPVVLTDEILIRDTVADAYRKVSLATLQGLMVGPGGVIQTSYAEYLANTDLTTVIPVDDTIPQNTEGTEILTATITPKFSTSRILVQFQGYGSVNTPSMHFIAGLFRDAAADALAAVFSSYMHIAATIGVAALVYSDSPSTTSAITYRIRVGPQSAATIRMNGTIVSRYFGGVGRSTLVVQEIKQ
jgi:hypothetical protein